MENGRRNPIQRLQDGTIDVERLHVESQDGHVSMDSALCFNQNIPENTIDMEDVSCRFGVSDTGTAQKGEDIFNGEVLDAMPREVEAGYLRLHDDDFCSMGNEYLLGVQFESITNLDYGSSEGSQTSFLDSQMQVPGAGSGSACKSDRFRMMEVRNQIDLKDQFNVGCAELSNIPSYDECEMLIGEETSISPRLCSLQNIGKFDSSSSCSLEDIFSDENDGRRSALGEMFCSSKTENNNELEVGVQDGETNIFQRQEALATMPVQANCTDVLPTQKRSRKPTQRYIDELTDPILTYSKKRRDVSSSTLKVKNKSVRVKDHKCRMGTRPIRLPAEESSVIAIQVPFGSLLHNECPKGHLDNKVECVSSENLTTSPKGKRSAPENQKKRDECITAVYLKKRDDCVTSHKRGGDCSTAAHLKKEDDYVTSHKKGDDRIIAAHLKKRDDYVTSHKKGDDYVIAVNLTKKDDYITGQKKGDDCVVAARLKKRDDHAIAASPKKKNGCTTAATPKKKDKHSKAVSQFKRDVCPTALHHQKKRENSVLPGESPEEVSARRKHHRLWTIAEVRKLIDGVSQYGVGRWSRIKKLFFSTSAHRTSVDLKDKWRNLLKASGILEQGNHQQGEKKRNLAWRPLPKSILRRVCELADMYPYPKCERPKKSAHVIINNNKSPDRSTDITLSDYRRMLRSISGD